MTYTRKIFRGSVIIFIGAVLAGLTGYLIRIILARSLSPEDYGLFYAIFAFVSFFLFFRGFGLEQAVVKYIAEFNAKRQFDKTKTAIVSTISWQLLTTCIFCILLIAFSNFLGAEYFKHPSASLIIKLFSLYVLLSLFVTSLRGFFQGFHKMKLLAFVEPARNIVNLILIPLFIYLGFRVFSAVYSFIISWIVALIIFLPFVFKYFNFSKYKVKNFGKISKMLFAFGLPVLLTDVGGRVVARLDTLILTYFRSLSEVGVYNIIMPSALLFLFFGESVSAVVFPIISELWAKKDVKRLSEWVRLVYKYSFVAIAPILLSVLIFSELFIKLFFGAEYVSGAFAFKILLVAVLFLIVARLNFNTLAGIGKPKIVTKIVISTAIINFIGNIVLIPYFGIEGAASATLISFLAMLVLSTQQIHKFIEAKSPWLAWFKTLFCSLVFVSLVMVLKKLLVMNIWVELVITIAIAGVVYLALAYLFKLIDVEEIKKHLKLAI